MSLLRRISRNLSYPGAQPRGASFNGVQFLDTDLVSLQQTLSGSSRQPAPASYVAGSGHPLVAAAVEHRSLAVAQVQFRWRTKFGEGRGRLFGNRDLSVLERPSSSMSRVSLLTVMEQHVSYFGAAYVWYDRSRDRMVPLRPDWVVPVIGSDRSSEDPAFSRDAELVGYLYHPGGRDSGVRPEPLTIREVAAWVPNPHPNAWWHPVSWVQQVWRDIAGDVQVDDHVDRYFGNATTANMVVRANPSWNPAQFDEFVDRFEEGHRGGAWRNIYLPAQVELDTVGANLAELDMKNVQGKFENRIQARSRVPAVILQIREGMQGSALNSGNYAQTRRMWVDSWLSPHLDSLCAAFEPVLDVPEDAELTYDPDRMLVLQEDRKDAADILNAQAATVETLFRSGFKPDDSVDAVVSGDLSKLAGAHTGLASVQTITDVPTENGENDG